MLSYILNLLNMSVDFYATVGFIVVTVIFVCAKCNGRLSDGVSRRFMKTWLIGIFVYFYTRIAIYLITQVAYKYFSVYIPYSMSTAPSLFIKIFIVFLLSRMLRRHMTSRKFNS